MSPHLRKGSAFWTLKMVVGLRRISRAMGCFDVFILFFLGSVVTGGELYYMFLSRFVCNI